MNDFRYSYIIKLLEHASLSVASFSKDFFRVLLWDNTENQKVEPSNTNFLSYSVHSIIPFIYIKRDLRLRSFLSEI